MMAAIQEDDETFVYIGGNQRVPDGFRRARIHEDIKIVRANTFRDRQQLIYVEFHDGIKIIEAVAFRGCVSLRGPIKLLGVRIIKQWAFQWCYDLTDVEFGDKLETIDLGAFRGCETLKKIRMPSVRIVGMDAFSECKELSDVEFGEGLRTLQARAFTNCRNLKRVALPLKGNMIETGVFNFCSNLTTVDLVGGIHDTVASLHLESWRNEMNDEINRINQVLPTILNKTFAIRRWMETVIRRLNRRKTEHEVLIKEAATLLELALWKAMLCDSDEGEVIAKGAQRHRARKEMRVTSGADVVIKNVLPFLAFK